MIICRGPAVPRNTPMNMPPLLQTPETGWHSVLGWSFLAALAGLGCVVLPPYLLPGANKSPAYGHPLIPWFAIAFANLHLLPTMSALFVSSIALGVAQPRRWLLVGCLSVSLPPVLNAINITHDWTIDPTDHNLFPFEFAILAFASLPALPGAFLGSRIRRVIYAQAA
jgi:hypothetical protein